MKKLLLVAGLFVSICLYGQDTNKLNSPFYDLHEIEYINLYDDFGIDFWIDKDNINKLVVRLGDLDWLTPYEKDGYIYTQGGRILEFIDMTDNFYSFELSAYNAGGGFFGGRKWYNEDDSKTDGYRMSFKFYMQKPKTGKQKIKRFEFGIEYKFDTENGGIYANAVKGPDILYVFENGKVKKTVAEGVN
tara:strand:- start:3199 stop:3765 length:567 start_codon:yes stop_codon:yes gene_type:complete